MRVGFLIGLLALGVVLILYVTALEQIEPVMVKQRLTAPLARVPVATNQNALEELRLALHDHDLTLIATMVDKGKALSVANDRRVAVLARYQTAVIVEILEGSQAGKTVWVLPSFLAPDSPGTSVPPATQGAGREQAQ